jgi:predicted hydrocarbon binding protein
MANPMTEKLKASITFDAARSRISVGGEEFAYHCDKFNIRIIKGLEDVLGPAKARELIMRTASQNLLEMFKSFAAFMPEFQAASVAEKLMGFAECWKILGFGAVTFDKMDGSSTQARSTTSYLAEVYLENMQRWGWPVRKTPFCYDLEGYLQAAFAVATGKDLASISVTETQCRTTGADSCIFEVEVK